MKEVKETAFWFNAIADDTIARLRLLEIDSEIEETNKTPIKTMHTIVDKQQNEQLNQQPPSERVKSVSELFRRYPTDRCYICGHESARGYGWWLPGAGKQPAYCLEHKPPSDTSFEE
jgi:hypothetical protein